ncbi:MAG TPA: nuclear transport factor 2 family protein [Planctomycetota bacterium]|nr:nuclear transport factor 2 family protein [Planctomycetota bacterium]
MSTTEATDRTALENTVTGVAHFIDRKAWRELRGLFADKVRTDYTSLFGGKPQEQAGDALIDAWRKLLAPVVTQHLLGPITLSIDGAVATAHCHVRGYHFVKGAPGGDEWMVAGHYVMELAKSTTAWRIRSLTLETFYQSGNLKLLEVAGGR